MKITRRQLRQIIKEEISEGLISFGDTGVFQREIENSSWEEAMKDAEKRGKSYFVQPTRDLEGTEVIEMIKSKDTGKVVANVTNLTPKAAFERKDGVVHYRG